MAEEESSVIAFLRLLSTVLFSMVLFFVLRPEKDLRCPRDIVLKETIRKQASKISDTEIENAYLKVMVSGQKILLFLKDNEIKN